MEQNCVQFEPRLQYGDNYLEDTIVCLTDRKEP